MDLLGTGGMGQVYRARDARLKRDVALKVLPPSFAADPDRLVRFEREAQTLAALNHPHIAAIYGIEDIVSSSAGEPPLRALVMELVDGETLADRIARGPMAVDEAIPAARQVASALEAAHDAGIIHRDLKPANIKVRGDGTVKVLDFGLAKADPGATGATGAAGATVTSPAVTQHGVILGTAAYMSPEQARGRPVDKRADIWAYGAVLFEMLNGEPLVALNQSVTETIASVIKDNLRLDRLPPSTPPALRTLIARCLERDPAERLRDIGEARILLSRPVDATETPTGMVAQPRSTDSRRVLAVAVAAVLVAGLAAWAAWAMKPTTAAPPVRRLDLAVPTGLRDLALSNDASRIAYIAGNQLYVRRLDELEAKPIASLHVTAGQLVWAPDDRAIAFTADSKIHTIPPDGGPPFVVASVPASGRVMGVAWLPNNTIVFSVWRDSLYGVPATGGAPTVQLAIDAASEIDFHEVGALPDNRVIVSTHRRKEDADIVELVELSGDRRRIVLTRDPDVRTVRYVGASDDGVVLFARESTNAGIWAVPFAASGLDFNAARLLVPSATSYTVARDGTVIALIAARARRALVWIDHRGTETPIPGDAIEAADVDLALSPDGQRAAFVQGDLRSTGSGSTGSLNGIVVVRDLKTGVDTRLSTSTGPPGTWADVGLPTWSADGQRLIHRTGRIEGMMLVERRADIAGGARTLTTGTIGRLLPDGRTLVYVRDERGSGRLERAVIGADGRVGTVQPLFPTGTTPNVRFFDISADGRLIAFVAEQQGQRTDVFMAELANMSEQWLVVEGGDRPRFGRDSRSLYFNRGRADAQGKPEGQLVRVSIATSPRISLGSPEVVLRDRADGPSITSYDVAPDGRRFLMFKSVPPRADEGQRLVLVDHALAGSSAAH